MTIEFTHRTRHEFVEDLDNFYNDGDDRSNFFPVPDFGRGIMISAATTTCDTCHLPVSISDIMFGEVHWDRIQGDSRNGHSPTHNECYERTMAVHHAEDLMWDALETLWNAGEFDAALRMFAGVRNNVRGYYEAREAEEARAVDPEITLMQRDAAVEAARAAVVEAQAARDARVKALMDEVGVPQVPFCECEACQAEFDRGFNDFND